MANTIFHLAFPVNDIAATRRFYIDLLGFKAGRESSQALIMNISGHQVVAQLSDEPEPVQNGIYPRHYGLIFTDRNDWKTLIDHARSKEVVFYREPTIRFPGKLTEHETFFLQDPSNNLLEFKFYKHPSAIFGASEISAVGDETRK